MRIGIYHSQDNDGYACAAIYKYKFKKNIRLVPWTYGDPFPDIHEGDEVYLSDVTFPIDKLKEVCNIASNVIICDHHVSAYNDYISSNIRDDYDNLIYNYNNKIAGCEVLWKYLYPYERCPDTIRCLGVYDSWRKNDELFTHEFSKTINFYFQAFEMEEVIDTLIYNIRCMIDPRYYHQSAIDIQKYVKTQNAKKMKNAYAFDFHNKKTIACFDIKGSGSFESIFPEKYDILMAINPVYNGLNIEKYSVSLYSLKNTDCSEIAKLYGGGGHFSSAGFIINDLKLLNI